MTKKTKLILIICLPLLGILAGYYLMTRQVTIIVDGESTEVTTRALTVRGALRSAGVTLDEQDQIAPPASSWLSDTTTIIVESARLVQVWNDSTQQLFEITTAALTPAEMLAAAGILPTADDLIRINGVQVPLNEPVSLAGTLTLQYTPTVNLIIDRDGANSSFQTTAPSLGKALWDQGITLHGGDDLNQSFTGAIDPNNTLTIRSAVPLIITADNRDIETFVSATTVGEALAMAGITLQDLDFSRPSETDPLPEDRRIEVVRVKEEIIQEQQSIPYTTESTTDESLSIDQTKVVTPGEYGLQVVRVHVRYENGVEVSRIEEDAVVIKQPVNEVVAYGTSADVKTIDTPYGTLTYWNAMTVTATSYSPCNSGADECYPLTRAGSVVQRGVIAVHSDWYALLKGTRIYIPGYGIGVVSDTGVYPYNHNWIDLGYTDEEYAQVAQKTFPSITVYFLMPYPSSGPVVLP